MPLKSTAKNLVAFASLDGIAVDQHFGHARYWQIYDFSDDVEFVETRKLPPSCSGQGCCGNFDSVYELLKDCKALFVAKIGEAAAAYMIGRGLKVFEAAGTIDRLVPAIKEQYGKII